jgi:hypothetical protein
MYVQYIQRVFPSPGLARLRRGRASPGKGDPVVLLAPAVPLAAEDELLEAAPCPWTLRGSVTSSMVLNPRCRETDEAPASWSEMHTPRKE